MNEACCNLAYPYYWVLNLITLATIMIFFLGKLTQLANNSIVSLHNNKTSLLFLTIYDMYFICLLLPVLPAGELYTILKLIFYLNLTVRFVT